MQNQSRSDQSREKKREQFADGAKSKSRLWIVIPVVIAAAVILFFVFYPSGDNPSSSTVTSSNPSTSAAQSAVIRIPLSEIGAKAKFFDYNTAEKRNVRFFVMKSSDGIYRAALDACDTCFHAKKGYHQEGDDMVCNNCGLKFHSSLINERAGGCNPIGLPQRVEGDQIVIKTSDLEGSGRFF